MERRPLPLRRLPAADPRRLVAAHRRFQRARIPPTLMPLVKVRQRPPRVFPPGRIRLRRPLQTLPRAAALPHPLPRRDRQRRLLPRPTSRLTRPTKHCRPWHRPPAKRPTSRPRARFRLSHLHRTQAVPFHLSRRALTKEILPLRKGLRPPMVPIGPKDLYHPFQRPGREVRRRRLPPLLKPPRMGHRKPPITRPPQEVVRRLSQGLPSRRPRLRALSPRSRRAHPMRRRLPRRLLWRVPQRPRRVPSRSFPRMRLLRLPASLPPRAAHRLPPLRVHKAAESSLHRPLLSECLRARRLHLLGRRPPVRRCPAPMRQGEGSSRRRVIPRKRSPRVPHRLLRPRPRADRRAPRHLLLRVLRRLPTLLPPPRNPQGRRVARLFRLVLLLPMPVVRPPWGLHPVEPGNRRPRPAQASITVSIGIRNSWFCEHCSRSRLRCHSSKFSIASWRSKPSKPVC